MLAYHFRLALKSLQRNPVIAALMIGAIALGVGICITTLTVYRLMSSNPIQHRNDVLYAVTLDNWDPNRPWRDEEPARPPTEVTYRDGMALMQSGIPDRKVIMRKANLVLDLEQTEGAKPFLVETRLTTKDFFPMFDVPFLYGGGWNDGADDGAQQVVVLTKKTNEKAFGGADSVGRTVRLDGRDYEVVGVLDEWEPTPKFYDLNNERVGPTEDIFIPYSLGAALELELGGNLNCWHPDQPLGSYQNLQNSDCVWNQMWVELRDAGKVEAFQSFMDNYVREQKQLGRFQRPLNNHLQRPDEWLAVNKVVPDDNRVLVGLSFMFLAVCLLNMIGLLLAKFLASAPLVGLRRALGASKATIFRQHLVEVGVIGLGGGVFGLGVAALGLAGLRRLYDSIENVDALTRLDVPMGLAALGIAVLSGVLAGLYPTWRICSIQPAAHLKTQ